MGTDIDYLMLHGKTKPTRVKQKVAPVADAIDVLRLITFCYGH